MLKRQRAKGRIIVHYKNSGNPSLNFLARKSSNTNNGIEQLRFCRPHGFGNLVVVRYQRRGLAIKISKKQTDISLKGCVNLLKLRSINISDKTCINEGVIHVIGHIDTLKLAYEEIKSQFANTSIKPDSFDGLTVAQLELISRSIICGKYRFSPAKKVQIPKPGKTETRTLGIAPPREKIVQKAIQMVLEAIFEPTFRSCSHGFRPAKGNHTALESIKFGYSGVT